MHITHQIGLGFFHVIGKNYSGLGSCQKAGAVPKLIPRHRNSSTRLR
jgi:hypothetical protein